MKIKYSVCFLMFLIFSLTPALVLAEMIYFRNGTVVNERIVERGAYYISTMKDGQSNKYFLDEIEHIEEDTPEYATDMRNFDFTQYEGISEKKVRLILTYIDVSGVRRHMQQNIERVIGNAPESSKRELTGLFDVDEIIEQLVPLYDKYYGEEDLIGATEFYKTSAGKKVLEVTPQIVQESVNISLTYLKEKSGMK